MIAGIDSMTLVYAGIVPQKRAKKKLTEGQMQTLQKLKKRAKYLFQELHDNKALVVLPTIALSELLVPVPPKLRGALIAKLTERFQSQPFDNQAAIIAASLWAKYRDLPADQQYESRQVLKADAMIVGTAKAFGATDFYTHDQKCRTLASLVMNAHDLPTHRYDLFADSDDS